MTRILTIMGSGETAPTMVKVHRHVLDRVGAGAVLLDTPYGFQENADDISAKTRDYFAQSVGYPIEVASLRSAAVDAVTHDRAMGLVSGATYVFAGPGSPTYALTQWRDTPMAAMLASKLLGAGAVTFASAAALTLGVVTLPVYEIYKAGHAPEWHEGLNLLEAATGLRAAVIPHYDNAEGGHHDTRFCYLGERRLAYLETELPDGAFVLGVDEHTALVIDLDRRRAEVLGRGFVTVRRNGSSQQFAADTQFTLDELTDSNAERPTPAMAVSEPAAAKPGTSPLMSEATRLETVFAAAIAARDVPTAVNATLELDRTLVAWEADTLQSDEPERVRATLRSLIVQLGDLASKGARDPRAAAAPFVDALLTVRAAAKEAKNYALADLVRARLVAIGVEVRDTPDGVTWVLDAT